jgi:hypothetical protein
MGGERGVCPTAPSRGRIHANSCDSCPLRISLIFSSDSCPLRISCSKVDSTSITVASV